MALKTKKGAKVIFKSPEAGQGKLINPEATSSVLCLVECANSRTGFQSVWMRPENIIEVKD